MQQAAKQQQQQQSHKVAKTTSGRQKGGKMGDESRENYRFFLRLLLFIFLIRGTAISTRNSTYVYK